MAREGGHGGARSAAAPEPVSLAPAPERRRRRHGDKRRDALLAALKALLEDRALAQIGIEEVARRAGVTRSAFYFYFPTKAAAVAALMREGFEEMVTATADFLVREEGSARERLERSLTRGATVWHGHGPLVRALLDAAGSDAAIRAVLDQWLDAYTEETARRIDEERAAGRAPAGADPRDLARVLIGMNQLAFERDLRAGASRARIRRTVAALVEVWALAVYREP